MMEVILRKGDCARLRQRRRSMIALLAIVRKLMIIDLSAAEAQQVFALAAAILALGAVYWLVREQDRREQHA